MAYSCSVNTVANIQAMPRTSSTSRSDVRQRDRHKVYAAADFQHEGRGDYSPSPAIEKEGLMGNCSSRAATLARGEGACCDSKAASTGGRVGVRVRDRNSSHEAPAASAVPAAASATENLGSVGPGAEPPVAVASHAFAHEEPHTEAFLSNSSKSGQPDNAGDGLSLPDYERVGVLSSEEDTGTGRSVDRGCTTETSRRCHSGKEDAAGSRPGSTNTNNEEEAETLPDSFNLSDEYGLEGASTGRKHHDDDDDYSNKVGEPEFFGLDVESTRSCNREKRGRGQGRPAAGRYSRTRRDDDEDSSSGYESRQEKGDKGVYPSASDSDCSPSSSRERQINHGQTSPQPQLWFGRRTRQDSRRPLLTATKRNSRIVPVEATGERRLGESEGTRRHRRGRSRNGARHRSPPPRRHLRVAEDDYHRRRGRRGVSGPRSRDSRMLARTETESMSGEANYAFEEEVARLRRENDALKQHQERPRRLSDGGFEAELWSIRQDPDDRHVSRRSPRHSSRRRDPTVRNARHRNRLSRKNDAPRFQQRPRDRPLGGASSPADIETPPAFSSSGRTQDDFIPRAAPATSWSGFVSRSKPPPQRPGPAAWGAESLESPAEEVDLRLPRILVEGGFLWKLPYHNAGTPKRRWFQIKPAEGLLTTASGRLVVRPTVAGGGGAATWDGGGALSKKGNDGGSGKDPPTAMPMMRLRTAWPLVFIWVDPDKDLKRSPPREMCIEEIVDLARGHKTPAFWQQAAHRGIHTLPDPKVCFSLVGHNRTLDLAAETLSEAKEWVHALATVMLMIKRGGIATAICDPPVSFSRSQFEPVPCSDPGEVRTTEAGEHDTDTLCSEGVYPQRPVGAPAPLHKDPSQQDLSARSEAGGISKNAPLVGEGGAWSVDTIRAWRRRLFPAVTRGDVPAVLALFDQGCPVDLVQTGTGDTPILLACRLGDIEMTRECLRRGSRNDPHPEFGQTALHAAVASGQEACARLLLETAAPSRSNAVISNHKDPNKETPLHVACRGGYSGIVDDLLHHGADMRAVDKRGNTPLHGAAGGGHADALASLLDAGGDGVLEERNTRGERALHAAAAAGHIACVELLLGIAAEPDVPNKGGQTPFALASRGGHLAVTRLIRQYAPDAGTPSGGDAQFQALQLRRVNGGSATADALPRPHASGSASSGPGTPDRRRDLEHRCYAAAGLDQRQLDASAGGREPPPSGQHAYKTGADVVERGLLQGGGGQHKSGVYGHGGESHILAVPRPVVCDEQVPCSSPLSSSVPEHGSLFDGLQVYVVGGRQPLGSQHASGAAAAGRPSARSAHTTTTARTMVLDSHRLSMSSRQHQHQHQQWDQPEEQPQNYYPSSQHTSLVSASTASFSSGGLESNWRDHGLSAPSAVAPSPPMPLHSNAGMSDGGSTALLSAIGSTETPPADGGGTSHAGVPGSARALARMLHFNGNCNHTAPSSSGGSDSPGRRSTKTSMAGSSLSASTSSGGNGAVEMAGAAVGSASLTGGGAGIDGTPTEAIGSWMTSGDYDQDKLASGSTTSIPKLGQCGDEDDTEPTPASQSLAVASTTFSGGVDSPAISGGWISDSGTVGCEGVAVGQSFVVKPSKERGERPERGVASAPLPGLWRVFESQGYPYYLHEASGHSQWEDPRENETVRSQQLLSTMVATEVAVGAQDQVSDLCFEGTKGPRRKEKDVETATKEAVEAPMEMDGGNPPPASPIKPTGVSVAGGASWYVDTTAVTRSAEKSEDYGGEAESMPSKKAEQKRSNGEFFETALEENPGRVSPSVDSCGSTDSRDFGSIDEEEGLTMKDDEDYKSESSSNGSDDNCRSGVGGNTSGMTSHRSTDTTTSGGGERSEGDREDPDKGARGPLRPEVATHDHASIPVDRTDLSVTSSTCGTRNGHDDERKEQEEEEEEEWWQELDDETSAGKKF